MSEPARRLLSKAPRLLMQPQPARKLRYAQPSLRRAFAEQTLSRSQEAYTSAVYSSPSDGTSLWNDSRRAREAPSSGGTESTSLKREVRVNQLHPGVPSGIPIATVDGPVRGEVYILSQYRNEVKEGKVQLTKLECKNPKNPLSNYVMLHFEQQVDYVVRPVMIDGQAYYRAIVVVEEDPIVVGEGDHPKEKEAIRLAALSAVYQLHDRDLLHRKKVRPAEAIADIRTTITMPDGTVVSYNRSRAFIEYYCRRFLLPPAVVAFAYHPATTKTDWEAELSVGGRRIGRGTGLDKQSAKVKCYLDVVRYMEACDPQLWKDFLEMEMKAKENRVAKRQKIEANLRKYRGFVKEEQKKASDDVLEGNTVGTSPSKVAIPL
ncbi:hypothetical protein OE88DRAFT_1647498 [Heliocybe sulcata]|uniref:DRBM domain-containing protein n=1 Tax=Heliocybe sulcata TaxID=5364 RepID=A0A5C3MRP9_9AGAM|nr:hypothetical protein OE88DRAFT_1647498 [Heliocybe sulcata]